MRYIINLIIILLFISCQEDCKNDNAPPPTFKFKLENKSLVNITNQGNYSIDSIFIVGYLSDSLEYYPKLFSHGDYFYFGTNLNSPIYLINYSNNTTDSIRLDYSINTTDYCKDMVTDFSVMINEIEKCKNCSDSIIVIQK